MAHWVCLSPEINEQLFCFVDVECECEVVVIAPVMNPVHFCWEMQSSERSTTALSPTYFPAKQSLSETLSSLVYMENKTGEMLVPWVEPVDEHRGRDVVLLNLVQHPQGNAGVNL